MTPASVSDRAVWGGLLTKVKSTHYFLDWAGGSVGYPTPGCIWAKLANCVGFCVCSWHVVSHSCVDKTVFYYSEGFCRTIWIQLNWLQTCGVLSAPWLQCSQPCLLSSSPRRSTTHLLLEPDYAPQRSGREGLSKNISSENADMLTFILLPNHWNYPIINMSPAQLAEVGPAADERETRQEDVWRPKRETRQEDVSRRGECSEEFLGESWLGREASALLGCLHRHPTGWVSSPSHQSPLWVSCFSRKLREPLVLCAGGGPLAREGEGEQERIPQDEAWLALFDKDLLIWHYTFDIWHV